MWLCGLKPHGNDELRQKWLGKIIPVARKVGLRVSTEQANEEPDGTWSFTMPDWAEVKRVIRNGGPASQQQHPAWRASHPPGAAAGPAPGWAPVARPRPPAAA